MQKNKLIFILLLFLFLPAVVQAAGLEDLKIDFLSGNYRRVVFEGQSQAQGIRLGNNDELNYILGLSYLKEAKIDDAVDCFKRILNSSSAKLKPEANLALADAYLISGQFQRAEDIYSQLLLSDANSKFKPTILFRLSQLEAKKGNHQKSNDYWLKLKRDFPLAAELKSSKILILAVVPAQSVGTEVEREYSVQVGFFASSANASNFKNILNNKNYAAYVECSSSGYRVKVGRFKSEQDALDLERKLSRDGFSTKICP